MEVVSMSLGNELRRYLDIAKCIAHQPRLLNQLPNVRRGFNHARNWVSTTPGDGAPLLAGPETATGSSNPLRAFFESRKTGRGVWKWDHYFDTYHRHFGKFVGRNVNVLEIGVYSGGSLEMWRHYFGAGCHVYGVDIEESCRCYEDDSTTIFIGDQGDRDFWMTFKEKAPAIDILVDDGGHRMEQQIVTLEEMLPHLRPGGVFLCEDITGEHNGFSGYMQGIVANLNAFRGSGSEATPTEFQTWIQSVHFYPFMTVIEKADRPARKFFGPKHGTEWQPFL
jgi:SAM-dependent methyltransferase